MAKERDEILVVGEVVEVFPNAMFKIQIDEQHHVLAVLRTVYTRAGVELTDPQESCKLEDIKTTSPGEQPCLGVRQ